MMNSTMLTLLDFYADWCGPCKVMKPTMDEVGKEFSGKVALKEIDVDAQTEIASRYGISSIPTLVFEKDGQEVARFIGAQSKQALITEIQKHLG